VETALTAFEESKQTQRDDRETTSGVKRKDNDNVDDIENQEADGAVNADEAPITPNSHQAYNTRFKGVKRVKMGREVPEGFPYTPHRRRAPRKSSPTILASGSQTKTTDENGAVKRPRGRPRKHPVASARSAVGRPTSPMKQVFDGVVVMKRVHTPKRPELEDAAPKHLDPEADADADAEGDMDGEAEEIIGPDSLEMNGFIDVADGSDHYDSNQGDPLVPKILLPS
jgi:hypothetical protein